MYMNVVYTHAAELTFCMFHMQILWWITVLYVGTTLWTCVSVLSEVMCLAVIHCVCMHTCTQ